MATHSSILAWRIPGMGEPGGLPSMGSLEDTTERLHFHFSLSCIGEGKWQPTPVFLPGESQGWRSLVGCCLWGRTESDKTEVIQQQQQLYQKEKTEQEPLYRLHFRESMSRTLSDNVARVWKSQDFPDSLQVKTLHFQCRRCESGP